ncbi:hypothetical protein AB0K67_11045 [Nonomuraea sp. NPDC052634]|uniref:hypothetical protein n=1 Tax=Nonomuraea sp. NPDC052634 TaxID=3155813 RepID=UPI00343C31C5
MASATVTFVTSPPVALTAMPVSGATFFAPFAGVIVSVAAGLRCDYPLCSP